MLPRFANHAFKSSNFSAKEPAAKTRQAIVAAPGIIAGSSRGTLFDDALIKQLLQIVIQSAGPKLVPPVRLSRHFPHDSVAVAILIGKGKQDVKCGSGQRQISIKAFIHSQHPIYRNPTIKVKPDLLWREKIVAADAVCGRNSRDYGTTILETTV